MTNDDIFKGVGNEIRIKNPEDFLKIKETLTRIGIASRRSNTLTQSCHILHKRGRYAIVHFKELFVLDGRATTLTEEDRSRRNAITLLLEEWGLATTVHKITGPVASMSNIKVISHKERDDWTLCSKYTVGAQREN